MKLVHHSCALSLLLGASGAAGTSLSSTPVDVHENFQFVNVPATISITNRTNKSVHLRGVVGMRASDRVLKWPRIVNAGETAPIAVQIGTEDDAGTSIHKFLATTDQDEPETILIVRNFGVSVLQTPRPTIDLGNVTPEDSTRWQALTLLASSGEPFEIDHVVDAPDFVQTRTSQDHSAVEVATKAGADYGIRQGVVHVALRSTMQAEAAIRVQANIRGDVSPSENPVSLGLLQVGKIHEQRITLKSSDGRKIQVASLTFRRIKGAATVEHCADSEIGCAVVRISIDPHQPAGRLSGELRIAFKNQPKAVRLPLVGLLANARDSVARLDIPNGAMSAAAEMPLDISKALKAMSSSNEIPSTDTGNSGPLLSWQASNNSRIHGYFISRAESKAGPYEMVAMNLSPHATGAYLWRDVGAAADKVYWYQMFAIHLDGHLQQLIEPQQIATRRLAHEK